MHLIHNDRLIDVEEPQRPLDNIKGALALLWAVVRAFVAVIGLTILASAWGTYGLLPEVWGPMTFGAFLIYVGARG